VTDHHILAKHSAESTPAEFTRSVLPINEPDKSKPKVSNRSDRDRPNKDPDEQNSKKRNTERMTRRKIKREYVASEDKTINPQHLKLNNPDITQKTFIDNASQNQSSSNVGGVLGVFEAILRAGEYTWLVGEEEEKKSGFLASSQVQFREFNQLTVFQ
jgi:hypothetical protein